MPFCGNTLLARNHKNVPFGVTYEKIGTIQRRLAWPLHKDDTLSRSGRPTGLNIYFAVFSYTSAQRPHHAMIPSQLSREVGQGE
ncbi:hypothetical protein BV20DRAFT_1077792 [Pilatotrama ljubarskyi]|nr:hypothetical protein BV20DRAFT_1077792 [Pilatotrama ljubarskyi]